MTEEVLLEVITQIASLVHVISVMELDIWRGNVIWNVVIRDQANSNTDGKSEHLN